MKLPQKKPAGLYQNFNVTLSPSGNPRERGLYNTLVLLVHLVRIIEPTSPWPRQMGALMKSLEPRLLPSMEVPADWKTRPLWKEVLA